jgi:hypothetical protein
MRDYNVMRAVAFVDAHPDTHRPARRPAGRDDFGLGAGVFRRFAVRGHAHHVG